MNAIPRLILKKGKDAAILRKHPWVFSGAVANIDGDPQDGDCVFVTNSKEQVLGTGFFHDGKITAQLFAFEEVNPDQAFWNGKIQEAYTLRSSLNLVNNQTTKQPSNQAIKVSDKGEKSTLSKVEGRTAYRLIHGEGDGMPGLIVDVYGQVAVYQAHSIGMHRNKDLIVSAIKSAMGDRLTAVYDASGRHLPPAYASAISDGYIFGEATSPAWIEEHGLKFAVDWEQGQKTGFFLDQRDNRALLQRYSKDARVLNTFCYTGGFSVHALAAGASHVDSVDSSATAMTMCSKNVEGNSFTGTHAAHTADVMDFLKESEEQYDTIILDPPAYAKTFKARHRAVIGYKRLNIAGMKKLKPGGVLFTFSCSQVVDTVLFQNTIMAAALESGREVQILHRLNQPADHPVSLYHPEGQYLKGLVLKVN